MARSFVSEKQQAAVMAILKGRSPAKLRRFLEQAKYHQYQKIRQRKVVLRILEITKDRLRRPVSVPYPGLRKHLKGRG